MIVGHYFLFLLSLLALPVCCCCWLTDVLVTPPPTTPHPTTACCCCCARACSADRHSFLLNINTCAISRSFHQKAASRSDCRNSHVQVNVYVLYTATTASYLCSPQFLDAYLIPIHHHEPSVCRLRTLHLAAAVSASAQRYRMSASLWAPQAVAAHLQRSVIPLQVSGLKTKDIQLISVDGFGCISRPHRWRVAATFATLPVRFALVAGDG